jgi:ATP-dependent Clp protease ATP-binding subunit ClpX
MLLDKTKKVMSVAVYNHYKRLMQQQLDDEVRLKKATSSWWDKQEQDLNSKTICQNRMCRCIVDATVLA